MATKKSVFMRLPEFRNYLLAIYVSKEIQTITGYCKYVSDARKKVIPMTEGKYIRLDNGLSGGMDIQDAVWRDVHIWDMPKLLEIHF
jgi:hypothetical protein